MNKRIIVGLGNIGKEYDGTRHNVGFLALDTFAKKYGFPVFSHESNLHALVAGTMIDDSVTLLVKPDTFMNKSGDAVVSVMNYYKLAPNNIMVIYDDYDLPVGEVRKRMTGSAGTHNGMRDIIAKLGTEDVPRIRIGIKPDHPVKDLSGFVLGGFTEDEKAGIMQVIDNISLSSDVYEEVD